MTDDFNWWHYEGEIILTSVRWLYRTESNRRPFFLLQDLPISPVPDKLVFSSLCATA